MKIINLVPERIAELEAMIAIKDAALKPFAEQFKLCLTSQSENPIYQEIIDEIQYTSTMTVGDFRRAVEALLLSKAARLPRKGKRESNS